MIAQIQSLLNQSEDELLSAIGRVLLADSMASGEPTGEEESEEGESWLRHNLSPFRSKICGSHTLQCYFEQDQRWDDVIIVAAIADLLSSVVTGVAPTLVAALLCKRGFRWLCKQEV
jgi:hypothetical protein